MYKAVAGKCQLKAAGGVRTIDEVLEFLKAGARRFGSTRTEKFVEAYHALSEGEREAFEEFVFPIA
jgi:deoxyribose-phosphate aldolase